MESDGSLLHSQVPITCPYPGPDQSSSCPPSHFLKIHFNIILPSMPGSSKWSLSHRFTHKNPVYTSLPHTCYIPCPFILLNLIPRIKFGEEYRSLSSSLCTFLHSPITLFLLGPNILLNTIFSNTLSLRSSLNMSDQVSHPYKTTGKIIVLCILTLYFWIANWKTEDSVPNSSKHTLNSVHS